MKSIAVNQSVIGSPLATIDTTPQSLRSTLVVAPHPDDETLGCGGTIALLRRQGYPVYVVIVSDGAASHSNSKRYPPAALGRIREAESRSALALLGVSAAQITCLQLPDGRVPAMGDSRFRNAVRALEDLVQAVRPETVLAPWRRDPHADHRAAWQLIAAAAVRSRFTGNWLEYPIWLWESEREEERPESDRMIAHRIDIRAVKSLKRRAVARYRSQLGELIDDDPDGFRLEAATLAHFDRDEEVFFTDAPFC